MLSARANWGLLSCRARDPLGSDLVRLPYYVDSIWDVSLNSASVGTKRGAQRSAQFVFWTRATLGPFVHSSAWRGGQLSWWNRLARRKVSTKISMLRFDPLLSHKSVNHSCRVKSFLLLPKNVSTFGCAFKNSSRDSHRRESTKFTIIFLIRRSKSRINLVDTHSVGSEIASRCFVLHISAAILRCFNLFGAGCQAVEWTLSSSMEIELFNLLLTQIVALNNVASISSAVDIILINNLAFACRQRRGWLHEDEKAIILRFRQNINSKMRCKMLFSCLNFRVGVAMKPLQLHKSTCVPFKSSCVRLAAEMRSMKHDKKVNFTTWPSRSRALLRFFGL